MSIWTTIRDAARGVIRAVAPSIPVIGPIVGALAQPGALSGRAQGFSGAPASMSALPAILPGAGAVARTGAMVLGGAGVARSVTAAARGAAAMCRKYPQWCVSVGGTAAIAAMMESGQLPVPKRRRRRGITPRDLQSFRRVASLIKTYSGPARKVPTRCAPRRKSC